MRQKGGDFGEKGGYTKTHQPRFMHVKEETEMHTQIFIYSTVYHWADRKEEHTNGFKNGFQNSAASSKIKFSNKKRLN